MFFIVFVFYIDFGLLFVSTGRDQGQPHKNGEGGAYFTRGVRERGKNNNSCSHLGPFFYCVQSFSSALFCFLPPFSNIQ